MHLPTLIVLIAAIIAQAVAAMLALRQLGLSGPYRYAWIAVSCALLLMIQRRVASLMQLADGRVVNFGNEVFGLVISCLMLVGLIGLRRLFTRLHEQEAALTRQTQMDFLTGLATRRYFTEQADQAVARAHRYGGPLGLLMLDIDFFKKINDSYGHKAGDDALRQLGRRCRDIVREVDVAGRVGGEEFAILLPETGPDEAAEVAERLRTTVAATPMQLADGAVSYTMTLSIGVAALDPDEALDKFMARADAALYEAKAGGRNRIRVASGTARK